MHNNALWLLPSRQMVGAIQERLRRPGRYDQIRHGTGMALIAIVDFSDNPRQPHASLLLDDVRCLMRGNTQVGTVRKDDVVARGISKCM